MLFSRQTEQKLKFRSELVVKMETDPVFKQLLQRQRWQKHEETILKQQQLGHAPEFGVISGHNWCCESCQGNHKCFEDDE
jgi:hypothetical protein